jgi:hypothetical protein
MSYQEDLEALSDDIYSITFACGYASASPEKLEKAFVGDWNLRDIISHLIEWNLITIQTINVLVKGTGTINRVQDENAFNKEAVERWKAKPIMDVFLEFMNTSYELLVEYKNVPSLLKNKPLEEGTDETIASQLTTDRNHYKEHHDQIVAFFQS